jgi:transcriptional regulator with XRE-family HTH domain
VTIVLPPPATRLGAYRRESRRTANSIAEGLGISRNYLNLMEVGDRKPGRHLAVRIEELTGIPVVAWDEGPANDSSTGSDMRTRREAAGLSRECVAARMGCGTQTLWRYETGRTSPTVATLAAFDSALSMESAPEAPRVRGGRCRAKNGTANRRPVEHALHVASEAIGALGESDRMRVIAALTALFGGGAA